MKVARSSGTSAANETWNFARSRSRKPSTGGRIGGTGAPSPSSAEGRVPRVGRRIAINPVRQAAITCRVAASQTNIVRLGLARSKRRGITLA